MQGNIPVFRGASEKWRTSGTIPDWYRHTEKRLHELSDHPYGEGAPDCGRSQVSEPSHTTVETIESVRTNQSDPRMAVMYRLLDRIAVLNPIVA